MTPWEAQACEACAWAFLDGDGREVIPGICAQLNRAAWLAESDGALLCETCAEFEVADGCGVVPLDPARKAG